MFDAAGLAPERTVALGYSKTCGKASGSRPGKQLYHSYCGRRRPPWPPTTPFSGTGPPAALCRDAGLNGGAGAAGKLGAGRENINQPTWACEPGPGRRQIQAGAAWKALGFKATGTSPSSRIKDPRTVLLLSGWKGASAVGLVASRAGAKPHGVTAGVGFQSRALRLRIRFGLHRDMLQTTWVPTPSSQSQVRGRPIDAAGLQRMADFSRTVADPGLGPCPRPAKGAPEILEPRPRRTASTTARFFGPDGKEVNGVRRAREEGLPLERGRRGLPHRMELPGRLRPDRALRRLRRERADPDLKRLTQRFVVVQIAGAPGGPSGLPAQAVQG